MLFDLGPVSKALSQLSHPLADPCHIHRVVLAIVQAVAIRRDGHFFRQRMRLGVGFLQRIGKIPSLLARIDQSL